MHNVNYRQYRLPRQVPYKTCRGSCPPLNDAASVARLPAEGDGMLWSHWQKQAKGGIATAFPGQMQQGMVCFARNAARRRVTGVRTLGGGPTRESTALYACTWPHARRVWGMRAC